MQPISIDFDKYITTYPDFPKPGILFRDVSPLLASAKGMNLLLNKLLSSGSVGARPCRRDRVARFSFSTRCCTALYRSMMIQPGKFGKLVDETYDLEYGSSLTMQADAPVAGRSVLVIDDLLATGGTMVAAKSLLIGCGAVVPACAVIVELAALGGRSLIDVPLIALQVYDD